MAWTWACKPIKKWCNYKTLKTVKKNPAQNRLENKPWRSCKKFWCLRKSAETEPLSRPSSSDMECCFSKIRPRTSLQSWKYLWSSLEASSICVLVSMSSPKSAQASFKASFHWAIVAASVCPELQKYVFKNIIINYWINKIHSSEIQRYMFDEMN